MKDNSGRTASGLRILVLLLLAGMCYQLGYNAGFTNGDWRSRQQQVWEAAGGVNVDPPQSADDGGAGPATARMTSASAAAIDLDDAAAAPHGLVLAPPVVLNGRPQLGAGRVAQAPPAPRALAVRVEPKS
jgi:hypothetical protein